MTVLGYGMNNGKRDGFSCRATQGPREGLAPASHWQCIIIWPGKHWKPTRHVYHDRE